MPLHLIKLCVGCESVQDLKDWIKERLAKKKKSGEAGRSASTRTRMVPKRADELVDGGSLFWVIKGELLCRERILAHPSPSPTRTASAAAGIVLDGKVKLVQPRPLSSLPGLALFWRQRMRPKTSTARRRVRATCPNRCGANCANLGLL